jgi:DNA-binding MltR family transcriptional regulator
MKNLEDNKNWKTFLNELGGNSDRVSIIVAVAAMDTMLTNILLSYLLPTGKQIEDDSLFGADRPLSSFSARIHLAFRLGLIDEYFAKALHLLRKMRNEFAHAAISGSLNDSPHKERVEQLCSLFPKSMQHNELEQKVMSEKDFPSLVRLLIYIILERLADIKPATISNSATAKLSPLGDDLANL